MLVDSSRVGTALKQLGDDVDRERRPDGSMVFTVPVMNHDAFRSFVLGFLEHAELLEPASWARRHPGLAGRHSGRRAGRGRSVSRSTAADRMRRVLAIVPWIVANPGRAVAEVAARFELTEAELLADLGVVFMVGLPPYSPDALVDVQIDDEGRVSIALADFFSRPLRLTPDQGLALVASSDALLSMPGTEPDGPLARALAKLERSLGVGSDDPIDVHLGSAEASHLERLRNAAAAGTEVEITYYSYGRDDTTTRGGRPVAGVRRCRKLVRAWLVPPGRGRTHLPGRPDRAARGPRPTSGGRARPGQRRRRDLPPPAVGPPGGARARSVGGLGGRRLSVREPSPSGPMACSWPPWSSPAFALARAAPGPSRTGRAHHRRRGYRPCRPVGGRDRIAGPHPLRIVNPTDRYRP